MYRCEVMKIFKVVIVVGFFRFGMYLNFVRSIVVFMLVCSFCEGNVLFSCLM